MRYDCNFDPKCDVSEVQQGVSIDLSEAFANHVVPSQVDDSELIFTNIESPSNIAGRPSDIFESIEAGKAFRKALDSRNSSSASSVSSSTPDVPISD